MSYQNLKAEMKRNGISNKDISEFLNMSVANFSLKLNGKVVLTVPEALSIKKKFFPDVELEYLLEETFE